MLTKTSRNTNRTLTVLFTFGSQSGNIFNLP